MSYIFSKKCNSYVKIDEIGRNYDGSFDVWTKDHKGDVEYHKFGTDKKVDLGIWSYLKKDKKKLVYDYKGNPKFKNFNKK